jgi:hypothetical protein
MQYKAERDDDNDDDDERPVLAKPSESHDSIELNRIELEQRTNCCR